MSCTEPIAFSAMLNYAGVFILLLCASTFLYTETEEDCNPLPREVLKNILGSAYNSRYMSITQPKAPKKDSEDMKRSQKDSIPFYVKENFSMELDHRPAWEVNHMDTIDNEEARVKRKAENGAVRQWDCVAKISWSDLGPGYFPRYLRSVDCYSKTCWYAQYSCKPRSFTVKILKRQNKCVSAELKYVDKNNKMNRLHNDLNELWVWEERAVNFCCYCSA